MSIRSDYHLHSDFSGDSQEPMVPIIEKAIQLQMESLCFTEHMDMDYPIVKGYEDLSFDLDASSYLLEFQKMKELYQPKISLFYGVELGLQPHLAKRNQDFILSYPFDFVIGSSHILYNEDVCDPAIYENRDQGDVYREYFESILENILCYDNFDIYGHLDYIVRYGPNKDMGYSYKKYEDIFEEILKVLIHKGKGIEINTGGLAKGLKNIHPLPEVLNRYRELGGEIVTVGSDAHKATDLMRYFLEAEKVLKSFNFKYYTVFENRKPIMKKLDL